MLVLAGCAGSAGERATTANEGVTTVAETETATDDVGTTAALPPGVNASGVGNATALVAAHRAGLSETGYTFRLRSNVSYEGEFDSVSVSRGTVAKQFAPFRISTETRAQTGDGPDRVTTDVWANESVALVRYSTRNRSAYRQYDTTTNATPEADPFSSVPTLNVGDQASLSGVVEYALLTGEYEVAATETRRGLTFTTLRATGQNRSLGERGFGNDSEYRSTLVVDELGRVHRLNLTQETNGTSVHYEFELTDVGGVVVGYPSWAGKALASVTAAIDVNSAGNHFVVSHEDGERLPPGSEVRVAHAGANYSLELTEPLRPGERVYVYFPAGSESPVLSREPPAEDGATPLRGEYSFAVVDPDGNRLLSSSFGFGSATPTEDGTEVATTTAES